MSSCARAARSSAWRPAVGDVDAVAPAVLGVAAADQVSALLQLVEQQHDVLGIHAQRVDELLLRRAVVVAQVAQRHEQAQVHAEQLGVAASHDLLGQPRQQDHRAGCVRIVLGRHVRTSIARIQASCSLRRSSTVELFIPAAWMILLWWSILLRPGRTPMSITTPTRPRSQPQPVGRACPARGRPADGRARRDDREHRAPLGAAGAALLDRQPAVDHHRLRAGLWQPAAARRQARRPVRSQVDADRRAHRALRWPRRSAGWRSHSGCSSPPGRCRARSARCSPPRRSAS